MGGRTVSISKPGLFRIRVTGHAVSVARTDLAARDHRIMVDEPVERGGTDLAATPLETMLAAFLSCTNVIANVVAEDLGVTISGMELSAVGEFDNRAVFGKADVPVPFPRITLSVGLTTDATPHQIEALRAAVAVRCPMSMILRQAGTRIEETWIAL